MKLTPESTVRAVNRLALMAFFPADTDVRAALVGIMMEMAETQEQVDWLVARALHLYPKWPGIGELRALYCSRFKPRDGIETYSSIFPGGIPSERRPPSPSPLPRGHKATADPEFEAGIRSLADAKTMPGRTAKQALPEEEVEDADTPAENQDDT